MPYSSTVFDDVCRALIVARPVTRCLDIGAGDGKYGRMVREHYPDAEIVAIEIEQDYIERFGLRDIYDRVLCIPAQDYIDMGTDEQYDLVILGDVIEHLRKSDGTDLLHFLVYRARYLLIRYPERLLQGTWEGYRHEAHISTWTPQDFAAFDHVYLRRQFPGEMRFVVAVVLDGYLRTPPSDVSVKDVFASHMPRASVVHRVLAAARSSPRRVMHAMRGRVGRRAKGC